VQPPDDGCNRNSDKTAKEEGQEIMTESVVEILDVRNMAPRERHPTIFACLDALKPGESLRLVNDHDPAPLRYQLIAEHPNRFTWEPEMQGPEDWIVCIRRTGAEDQPASSANEREDQA
jgi:uncharacterized protein (DUF2249 family)